jgi:dolichol-phosphate mannosyltransferase
VSNPTQPPTPRVSVVIPAYNEGEQIAPCLQRILEAVTLPCEILVVVDMAEDTTVPVVEQMSTRDGRLCVLINSYGRGPANAIRYGIDHAGAPVAVVTMADGSDDPRQIDDLTRLVERGVVVAAASRYMPGGQQVGGPLIKSAVSKAAGRSLQLLTRVGTRDATNSFKAYSTDFVREVGVDSRAGFEIGIELTAKAKRLGRPVAEIPTIWLERSAGVSSFKVAAWIPQYLRWYRLAFGPRVDVDHLRTLTRNGSQQESRPALPPDVDGMTPKSDRNPQGSEQ